MAAALLGGTKSADSADSPHLSEIARFAIEQQNASQNSQLSFIRLVSAKTQVVSGILYHLIVEVELEGCKKLYEAKVLEKAWANFKSLESFIPHHQGSQDIA